MANDIQTVAALFAQGRLGEAEQLARKLTRRNHGSGIAWKALSVALKLQGRTAEALEPMRIAANLLPGDPEASNNLGTTCRELGLLADAEAAYRRSVKIRAGYAEGHYNLAILLRDLDRLEEAEASARQAVTIKPGYVEAYNALGVILKGMGRLEEAVETLQRALELNPRYPDACNNLGSSLNALGRLEEAKEAFRNALKLKPDFGEAYNNLGATLFDEGSLQEAEENYRLALKYRPDYAQAHYNLGITLKEQGRPDEAMESYRLAIKHDPKHADSYNNLAILLNDAGRSDEAETLLRKALELAPNHVELLNNLGLVCTSRNRPKDAEAALRRALEIKPDHVEALNNLGMVLMEWGRPVEAEANFRRAIQLEPDNVKLYDTLLFCMNYAPKRTASQQLEDARAFGAVAARKAATRYESWSCQDEPQRLRVGMVSGDFRNHPVGYFLEGLLSHLDQSRIELVAYSTNRLDDDLTEKMKPFFSRWRTLNGKDDAAAAEVVHGDGVHLLLDLAGHTAGNRLGVFAHRPAPVQATWLGYSGTTGLAEMNYLIGDPYVTPQEAENQFTEKIRRLPEIYLCLTAPNLPLQVGAPPAAATGHFTFGSFNNLNKMNEDVVKVWARILDRVPGSKLFLMTKLLNDPAVCEWVRQRFSDAGISPDRLLLQGTSSREQVLGGYRQVDLALDPFPYNGTTTSAEAIWMGVPVVTRRGDSFLSRVGESIVTNVGGSEWVAEDDDDYVAKAVSYASDPELLLAARRGLRDRALGSPLFDISRFARNFENALWEMWREKRG